MGHPCRRRIRSCMVRLLFLFAASMAPLALLPSQSAAAAPREASCMRTILMLGDSLTDGYGVSRSQAYPTLISAKLRSAGLSYEVINAGVSGDTTGGGLR